MNQYPDRDARPLAVTPEEPSPATWSSRSRPGSPTPRWRDSAARTRIARTSPARQRGSTNAGAYQQVKRRFDLIGWLLAQPSDRIVFNDDPHDPRAAQPPAGRDLPLWRATRRLNALQYCACIDAPFLPASPGVGRGLFCVPKIDAKIRLLDLLLFPTSRDII